MKKNKIFVFLLGGISFLLAEGVFVASLFVFWNSASLKETSTQANVERAIQPFVPSLQETKQPIVLDRFSEVRNGLVAAEEEFLEINFSQNKVFKYEKGSIVKEAPILAKGDPQGWGGTPAGLYQVLGKDKSAFSSIAQVYMPYAVHLYGKYYLHGEPHYSWGEKTGADVSGGCIQLQDSSAKAMYELVEPGIPVLIVDKENGGYPYAARESSLPPAVSAQSYLVADIDSGFVFAEKNSQEVRPIASLTKLMTALVVAENIDLRKSVEVTPGMLEAYGTLEGLEQGKRYRVVELFYPMLIASSNDASEAVAGFLGRDRSIQMMNDKAKALFLSHTTFVDPTGFDAGNVSTAQDLFYLARYIVNNRPPLFEITKGKEVRSYGEAQFARGELWNKNIFVADSSFAGGKTGYTSASKHTGIFLFQFLGKENETRTIAFILLGSQDSKLDTQLLYGWVQRNYQLSPQYSL